MLSAILLPLVCAAPQEDVPVVVIDRDDTPITSDCVVELGAEAIADVAGDGVLLVTGDDITVDFQGAHLRGAGEGVRPDRYAGVGVVVTGKGVTLKNARISGFLCGIRVTGATDVSLEDCDVSDNFRQRLRSTPLAEDASDWLWPHANDNDEWLTNYGAGIWAEDCTNLKVRRCRARDGQNGLILVRTNESEVYDCDFSFLSGWGIALWRSSKNTITRNALDFCIRGYSHGVYNRGQDSAGILVFEQCNENVFAENSATHSGDGFFGFGGKEALGEHPAPDAEFDYSRRGCNGNVLWANDFSYAAAHGIEMTFSFDNVFARNRLVGNAICGVWGGYSSDTRILGNTIEANGDAGYALERGGVNIEHGRGNQIVGNAFRGNKCGVHLWWDEDAHLAALPWTKVNGAECGENQIFHNTFDGDEVGLQLRQCEGTRAIANTFTDVATEIEREGSTVATEARGGRTPAMPMMAAPWINGETKPVGARAHLAGRENILMTEWGPWDFEGLYARALPTEDPLVREHEILGDMTAHGALPGVEGCKAIVTGNAAGNTVFQVRADSPSGVGRYGAWFENAAGDRIEVTGVIVGTTWTTRAFAWTVDPREDVEGWRAQASGGVEFQRPALDLVFGHGSASGLADAPRNVADAALSGDRFGTIATTEVTLPAGRWRIKTTSDDGIRVWVDGDLVIDDWTWHPPKDHAAEITLDESAEVTLRVEHFELDGYAVLQVALEPLD